MTQQDWELYLAYLTGQAAAPPPPTLEQMLTGGT